MCIMTFLFYQKLCFDSIFYIAVGDFSARAIYGKTIDVYIRLCTRRIYRRCNDFIFS